MNDGSARRLNCTGTKPPPLTDPQDDSLRARRVGDRGACGRGGGDAAATRARDEQDGCQEDDAHDRSDASARPRVPGGAQSSMIATARIGEPYGRLEAQRQAEEEEALVDDVLEVVEVLVVRQPALAAGPVRRVARRSGRRGRARSSRRRRSSRRGRPSSARHSAEMPQKPSRNAGVPAVRL